MAVPSSIPTSRKVFAIPVAPGDVVIAGNDGFFGNSYNNEVAAVVDQALKSSLGPQVAAQKIATLAHQRAQDRTRQTPFSIAAQEAGFCYYVGKLDDITVVVSYITRSTTCLALEGCIPQYVAEMDPQLLPCCNCCFLCQGCSNVHYIAWLKGGGSWADGVQARYYNERLSFNATCPFMGS